ncbi:MAG: hypothetical protein Q9173_003259 [Seirophora scorigena]
MSYSTYLFPLCSGLTHEESIARCSTIVNRLIQKRLEDNLNKAVTYNGIYRFFNGFKPAVAIDAAPYVQTVQALVRATADSTASTFLQLHCAPNSKSQQHKEPRARIRAYERKIQPAWDQGAYDILPVDKYNPTVALSQHSMQTFCRLAEETDIDAARQAILAAIQERSAIYLEPAHLKKAPQPYALPSYPPGPAPKTPFFKPILHVEPPNPNLPMDFSTTTVPEVGVVGADEVEFEACDNGVDCGMLVLVAALYITADRPFPECIGANTWRIILRAALDTSSSVSDPQVLESLSSLGPNGSSDTSVDYGQDVLVASAEIPEVARRERSHVDLRKRIKDLLHAPAHFKERIKGIDEILVMLEIIRKRRNELYDLVENEYEAITAECERFAQLLDTVLTLGFTRYGAVVEASLAKPCADAKSLLNASMIWRRSGKRH